MTKASESELWGKIAFESAKGALRNPWQCILCGGESQTWIELNERNMRNLSILNRQIHTMGRTEIAKALYKIDIKRI